MERTLKINTEKIDKAVLERIRGANSEINSIINRIGTLYIERTEAEALLNKIETELVDLESDFVGQRGILNAQIQRLESTYKNGKLNLLDGTITFTSEN